MPVLEATLAIIVRDVPMAISATPCKLGTIANPATAMGMETFTPQTGAITELASVCNAWATLADGIVINACMATMEILFQASARPVIATSTELIAQNVILRLGNASARTNMWVEPAPNARMVLEMWLLDVGNVDVTPLAQSLTFVMQILASVTVILASPASRAINVCLCIMDSILCLLAVKIANATPRVP